MSRQDSGKSTLIFLTYGEQPSGIYDSQVVDVCHFLHAHFNVKVKLVSFVSTRHYWKSRKIIKAQYPKAILIPSAPHTFNWRYNLFTFCLIKPFISGTNILARGIFASNFAIFIKKIGLAKKVCYDGRGAIAAEWKEYLGLNFKNGGAEYPVLERKAINDTDYRLAVSNKLVDFWRSEYGYKGQGQIVVPCALGNDSQYNWDKVSDHKEAIRAQMGYTKDDVVLVYAGSAAGWQSFQLIIDFLRIHLKKNANYKMLFFSRENDENRILREEFPHQVQIKWLQHKDVLTHLAACDYGLLLREYSVTNSVAAPIKFAEYLASGLRIVLSDGIGDYSAFVRKHACGVVVEDMKEDFVFDALTHEVRRSQRKLFDECFRKESPSVFEGYKTLMQFFDIQLR